MTSPSVPVESREQPREVSEEAFQAAWTAYWRTIGGFHNGTPRDGVEAAVEAAMAVDHAELAAERDRARDLAAHLEEQLDAILNPTGWIHLENANRDALCGSTATTTMSRVENADCSACLALAAHLEAEQAEETK